MRALVDDLCHQFGSDICDVILIKSINVLTEEKMSIKNYIQCKKTHENTKLIFNSL